MTPDRSLIPKKVQVPIMIIAALIFTMLLVRQLAGRQHKPRRAPGVPAMATSATVPMLAGSGDSRIPLTDLQSLVIGIRSASLDQREHPPAAPPLPRNPFVKRLKPVEPPPSEDPAEEDPTPGTTAPAGPSRAERRASALARLAMAATCVTGSQSVALVNGRFVREGDVINGFTVKVVEEGKLTLEDDIGQESLVLRKELTP